MARRELRNLLFKGRGNLFFYAIFNREITAVTMQWSFSQNMIGEITPMHDREKHLCVWCIPYGELQKHGEWCFSKCQLPRARTWVFLCLSSILRTLAATNHQDVYIDALTEKECLFRLQILYLILQAPKVCFRISAVNQMQPFLGWNTAACYMRIFRRRATFWLHCTICFSTPSPLTFLGDSD